MKHASACFLCSFLFLLVWPSAPLFPNGVYSLRQITTANGLSQNDAKAIAQDSLGYIWVCTADGINRYDGYDFKVFRMGDNGLVCNFSNCVKADPNGDLWFGSQDFGLIHYCSSTEQFTTVYDKLKQAQELPLNIMNLVVDAQGNVWIQSGVNNLYRFRYAKEEQRYTCEKETIPDVGNIYQMELNKRKMLLLCTDRGLYSCVSDTPLLFRKYGSQTDVKKIQFQGDKVYMHIGSGVYEYFEASGEMVLITEKVKAMHVSSRGELWIHNDQGIHGQNLMSRTNSRMTLSDKHFYIPQIIEDRFGNIWLGSYRTGLLMIYNNKPFRTYASHSSVESVCYDAEGRLWVGELNSAVYCFADKLLEEKITITLPGNPKYNISHIAYHRGTNQIYISNREGIYFSKIPHNIRDIRFSFIPFVSVTDVAEDGDYMWIATFGGGLILYNAVTNKIERQFPITPDGISSEYIRAFKFDKYNNLWITTGRGLRILEAGSRFDAEPVFRKVKFKNKIENYLESNYLLPINYSHTDEMWVGTLGRGIFKLSEIDAHFNCVATHYITNDGLSNNAIRGIEIDDENNVWASTTWGLNKIDPRGVIRSYTKSDGLQDYEFRDMSCSVNSNGDFAFGGLGGLNVFSPASIVENKTIPILNLTDIYINNQRVSPNAKLKNGVISRELIRNNSRLRLRYDDNTIAFHFASIHYCAPEGNRYKYMLEGYDKEWILSGANNRIAKYSNLQPGRYRFRVMGSNNDDVWSAPVSVEIRIIPPVWRRWYAYLFYCGLILASVYLFVRIMIRMDRNKREIQLAKREKHYLKELHDSKITFFTNVSHEFRTPLTLIISSLQRLIAGKEMADTKREEVLQVIDQNSKILLRLINQTLNFAKTSNDDPEFTFRISNIVKFVETVEAQFKCISEDKHIELWASSTSKNILVSFDSHYMQEVFYNLFSNAIKHTPPGGRVGCRIVGEPEFVNIEIIDTGSGIDEKIKSKIFDQFYSLDSLYSDQEGVGIGLFLTKKLIKLHNGTISFVDNEGGGTVFKVRLPRSKTLARSAEEGVDVAVESCDVPNPGAVESREESSDEAGRVILVVDDNKAIVDLLECLLSDKYKIITAYDGEQGYAMCQKHLPALVVADIMMPNTDGVEMCRLIKTNEATFHIPVLILSAKESNNAKSEGFAAYADAFCAKPFDNEVLLSMIKSILQNRKNTTDKFRQNVIYNTAKNKVVSANDAFVAGFVELINENILEDNLSISFFAEKLNMTTLTLNKRTKEITGQTASGFIRSVKLKCAAELLATNQYSVKEVTYATGFVDLKYFRRCFKKEFGVLPSDYGSGAVDEAMAEE